MAFELDPVRQIADRVAASSGLEVVELEMRGGGKSRMLRIVIDKVGATDPLAGVTHEDCARLSREVSTILDVEDVVPGGSYVLEVSSPGLDRKLSRPADFQRFTGSRVKLTTRQPIDGNRHFVGRLESFQDGRLTVDLDGERGKSRRGRNAGEAPAPHAPAPHKLEVELSNIEKANLVPEI